jgi:alkylation response protein AidB-like acyl-CoA dehydrogenase
MLAESRNINEHQQKQSLPLTHLSEDEKFWIDKVKVFGEDKIRPFVEQMENEKSLVPELLSGLFSSGFMGIEIPKAYGGNSGSFFQVLLTIEEIARIDPSVAVYVDVHNILVIRAILDWGSGDQKRQYLPRLARTSLGAFALSEKEAGSDAFSLTTTARSEGDSYILNGHKYWTSNADEADIFLIFARTVNTEKGSDGMQQITAFLVERTLPGVNIGKKLDKLGICANSTCEIILENVQVGRENILGHLNDGNRIAIEVLNFGKVGIAAQLVGLAQGALDAAIVYSQKRKQFGQRIASFQGIQFSLARMATEIEAARLLVYNSGRLMANNPLSPDRFSATAMAKYFCSEVAERVASQAIDIFGGNGFIKDFPVEKFYRDAKVGKIYEGTSNMQLRTIASALLKKSFNEQNLFH